MLFRSKGRAMTMDAAFDQVGEAAQVDSPRATLSKKTRSARKPKADKDATSQPASATPAPAITPPALPKAPQPEPASAAATPRGVSDSTDAEKPTVIDGGAKILSLDQFRKK